MSGPIKTLLMLLSIMLGLLIPQMHEYSFLIRYFLMGMLFFAFLDIEFSNEIFSVKHIYLLSYLLVISFVFYFLALPLSINLALALFVTGIAPTAISAAPVISYLKGRVGYVTFCILLTNVGIALILPFLLPFVLETSTEIKVSDIVFPVISVILIPLGVAVTIKTFFKGMHKFFKTFEITSFFFFVTNIFLAMSSAGNYLRTQFNQPLDILIQMAFGILLLTVTNFVAGWYIGGKNFALESSNSAGQKNTMFAIWIALTFINPIVALGPMMYTVYHNLYVSYQLYSSK